MKEQVTKIQVGLLYNACWWLRNARTPIQRQQAVQRVGITVRQAFAVSDDFEPLLVAVVDGLRSSNEKPF